MVMLPSATTRNARQRAFLELVMIDGLVRALVHCGSRSFPDKAEQIEAELSRYYNYNSEGALHGVVAPSERNAPMLATATLASRQ